MTTSDNTIPTPNPNRGAKAWLIISQTLGWLSLLPWFMVFALAVMGLANSNNAAEVQRIVGAVCGYPILHIFSARASWILFEKNKNKAALIVTSLPLLVVVLFGILIAVTMFQTYLDNPRNFFSQ